MEKNFQYRIGSINYVMVTYPIASESKRREIVKRMRKYGCILIEARPVRAFWFSTYVICHILVPEDNLIQFNLEGLD